METRIPLSVPKSGHNCSQASSQASQEMAKPKKKIFSGAKASRAVFNMKNFWSNDLNSKKVVASKKKNTIFDVQYVWRPKTVTSEPKRAMSPTAPLSDTSSESSVTYLPSKQPTSPSLKTVSKPATKSVLKANSNSNSVKTIPKSPVKQTYCVSTRRMATRSTRLHPIVSPEVTTTSSTNDEPSSPIVNDQLPEEPEEPDEPEQSEEPEEQLVSSRPNTPSDTASNFSEQSSSAPSEASSRPISAAPNPSVESANNSSDVISSSSSESTAVTATSTVTSTTVTETQTIVKPKRKIFSMANKKNRAVFSAKNFWSSEAMDFTEESEQTASAAKTDNKKKLSDEFDAEDNEYVILRKVKKAHQVHDLGETEQFDDDIKYHLSGIDVTNTSAMRCLSIIGLTQQAMRPEFRMHLRAHDDMPRIISALMDVPSDPNLALCTAALMFVYSQDRLTMDIDPNALSLMLQLLETRTDECNGVEMKTRNKVNDICEQMKKKGLAKFLKMTEITAGNLAMETLLGLTSKRAGDWMKDELRRIKGVDFILDTVLKCALEDNNEGFMVRIDRCMHVLENVTFNHLENQKYILDYKSGHFISNCIKLLHSCKYHILLSNDSKVFLSAFFSILRVLTHLTSESADGCEVIGTHDGVIDLLLESVVELPSFIATDQRFDLMVILLCLCINLVEFCPQMRELVILKDSKLNSLIELLFKRIEEAQRTEQQTDELLESHEKVQMTDAMRDSLLHTMLSQSGNHMEHSIIAACIALLLGCTIQDNYRHRNTVRNRLPNKSFEPLVEVLQKLRDFAYLADIMTKKGKDRVDRIIQVFKSS